MNLQLTRDTGKRHSEGNALALENGLQQHLSVGCAHMSNQGGLLSKLLVAVTAHEGLHLQVDRPQMPVQVSWDQRPRVEIPFRIH